MLTLVRSVWEPVLEKRRQGIITVMAAIVSGGFTVYNNRIFPSLFSNKVLFLNVLFLSLISVIICHCKYWHAFCLVFTSWAVLLLADFFIQTLVFVILDGMELQPDILLTATVFRCGYLLAWMMVLAGAVCLIRKWGRRRELRVAVYLKWGWFLMLPLFVSIVYFQRIYKQLVFQRLVSQRSLYMWWIFVLGGMLLSVAVLAYLAVQRERERYWLLQQRTRMVEHDYRMMQREYQEKEIMLHDVGKHMRLIREMARGNDTEEIIRYLDDMDAILQKGRNRELVNHDLLNLVLNSKFREAEEAGISVRYELGDMGNLLLKPVELCALFTNILDNAIEANQAMADGGKRWISLKCIRRGEMLILAVSNPTPGVKLTFIEGIPQTSKKDKVKHGLGMQSIQQVVDIYEGDMQVKVQEGIFHLLVHLKGFD